MADHATGVEIHCKAGEDFTAKIEWLTESGSNTLFSGSSPSPLELAGVFAAMDVRDEDDTLLLRFENRAYVPGATAVRGYIAILPSGTIHLFVPWEVTQDLQPGSYLFDLFVDVDLPDIASFKPLGDKQRRAVCSGRFIVHPAITNRVLFPGSNVVIGPVTATTNTVPKFADSTGKTLAATQVGVDAASNISTPGTIAAAGLAGGLRSSLPAKAPGTPSAGTSAVPAREDHVHPGDATLIGTGSPEGVVSAPVGTTWRDVSATAGAILWIKTSGAGNTGWRVVYGDTGLCSVGANVINGWTAGGLMLRRIGSTVSFTVINLSAAAATSDVFYTIPAGFRANGSYAGVPIVMALSAGERSVSTVYSTGATSVPNRGTGIYTGLHIGSWVSDDPWPSVLPGTTARLQSEDDEDEDASSS